MSKSQRRKGQERERELAKLVNGKRVLRSVADGGEHIGDVKGLGLTWAVAASADEFNQLYGWLNGVDALAVRADRKEWLVVMPVEQLLSLLGNETELTRRLARGGTYCKSGAEKDRRAEHCKLCVARTWFDEPRRVARRERSAKYLAESRAGLTTREIAARDGINHQNVSRLIRLGRADENLTTPKITRIDGGKGGRHYQVEGYPEPFPSVTNVLGIIAKPALIPWARNTALEAVQSTLTDRIGQQVELSPEWIEATISEARRRPGQN